MNLRKKINVLMVLLAITVFTAMPTQNANAAIIMTRGDLLEGVDGPLWFTLSCLLLFPICAFNENSEATDGVSKNMLSESGYTLVEVDLIMNDQEKAFEYFSTNKIQLKLESEDTVSSVVSLFKENNVEISEKYAEFLLDYSGL